MPAPVLVEPHLSIDHIEDLMMRALKEDRQAAQEFYEVLFLIDLFVPERQQQMPLQHLAQYPDEILGILGIQDNERAIVPVFLAPAHIREWCGQDLLFREFSLKALLEILPEEWWLCINPGGEVAKELGPWELEQLKAGKEGIDEIIAELFESEAIDFAETWEPVAEEYGGLRKALRQGAITIPEIRQLFLLAQKSDESPETSQVTLLIGVLVDSCSKERLKEIREIISIASRRTLIGAEDFRVLIDSAFEGSAALALFLNSAPFYTR